MIQLIQNGRRELPHYCAIDPSIDLARYRARSTTGRANIDRALIAEMRTILETMAVNPGIRIIDDVGGPNAFAIDRTIVRNTRGTVLFGINLITSELVSRHGGYAVAGIAAHECAHIHQFFTNQGMQLVHQRTAKHMELHADLLAGFYLGKDKANEANIEAFARSLYGKGDFNFNHPQHHGTPAQRVSAMTKGYELAIRGLEFEDASREGVRYVFTM
jgi:Zn-dependent protease with chaperone function